MRAHSRPQDERHSWSCWRRRRSARQCLEGTHSQLCILHLTNCHYCHLTNCHYRDVSCKMYRARHPECICTLWMPSTQGFFREILILIAWYRDIATREQAKEADMSLIRLLEYQLSCSVRRPWRRPVQKRQNPFVRLFSFVSRLGPVEPPRSGVAALVTHIGLS